MPDTSAFLWTAKTAYNALKPVRGDTSARGGGSLSYRPLKAKVKRVLTAVSVYHVVKDIKLRLSLLRGGLPRGNAAVKALYCLKSICSGSGCLRGGRGGVFIPERGAILELKV